MNANHECDIYNNIRPSSSSLIRAPSWSFGVGSNELELDPHEAGGSCSTRRSSAISSIRENGNDTSSQNTELNDSSEPCVVYPKLDISIPTVYLTRPDQSLPSYHVYQLKIKTGEGHEWSIYRRYSQFHALHQQLRSSDTTIAKFNFPPKKRINSKSSTIVQDRRNKLEEYIRLINTYFEHSSHTSNSAVYDDLTRSVRSSNEVQSSGRSFNSPCGLSCLSDSVESDPLNDGQSEQDRNTITNNSVTRSSRNKNPSDSGSNSVKFSGKTDARSLFHNFISLSEQKDEEFNSSSTVQ